jgi:hypothetical protein
MQGPAAMKRSCGIALVCLIATLAGAANAARPTRAAFNVTLRATVTKTWNTAVESDEGGCTVVRRSTGRRVVTLRSARPTRVVVALQSGKAVFSPSAVRFVTAKVTQSGENSTRKDSPCGGGTVRAPCRTVTRRVGGRSFGFFRSGRNELSFRPATLPGSGASCPNESAALRALRPGLRRAQGEISELQLARGASQSAFGSAEEATELEGAETGPVVERVQWTLTFTRR